MSYKYLITIILTIIFVDINILFGLDTIQKENSHALSYSVNGNILYFNTVAIRPGDVESNFIYRLTNDIMRELCKINGITDKNKKELWKICDNDIVTDKKIHQVIKNELSFWNAIAQGIIFMHEQNISPEDVYYKNEKELSPLNQEQWQENAQKYTYSWAFMFMKYNEDEKIKSIAYQPFIETAMYFAYIKKIKLQIENTSSNQLDITTEIKKNLEQQIKSLHIKLPKQFESCLLRAQSNIFKIVDIQIPKQWENLIEALLNQSYTPN